MENFFGAAFYVLGFLSLYVQVFFLVTFLENRGKLLRRTGGVSLAQYPAVTLAVPCWNEESTVARTIESLLALNYPKDKLKILLVDDGSADNTLQVLKRFEVRPNIEVFSKENGGKHTALNFALEKSDSEFFGCLDADSFADPEALVRIMSYFEQDPATMAVAPSIIVQNPKTVVQRAQTAEYCMSIYLKKMLGFIGGIHVTPGPLTIFRRKVFDIAGNYRAAHNTEDMEIAYRMQKHRMKIEQCNDAYVYTNAPPSIRKLYKQRLRWIYGFLNNTLDYRRLLFRKKYGNFALFTVPAGIISVVSVVYLFAKLLYGAGNFIAERVVRFQAVGLDWTPSLPKVDPFFINTNVILFVLIALYAMVFMSIFLGSRIGERGKIPPINLIYFFSIYTVVAPFWLLRAIYNTVLAQKPSWR